MKKFICVVTVLLLNVFGGLIARDNVAKVVKIRGKATQLRPGALQASPLKLGDAVSEHTSILTYNRSFVRMEFIDGSLLNLGPKSKIIIKKVQKRDASVVNLLKGKIRTKVIKNVKKDKHKFFIKTRTAAMGVRGTDFHSSYNPENNISNVITYEGEVALIKLKENVNTKSSNIEQLHIEEQNDGSVNVDKLKAQVNDENSEIKRALNSSETVLVKRGQYSGVSVKLNKATDAVNINPVQFVALEKNYDLNEKSVEEAKKGTKNKRLRRKKRKLFKEAKKIRLAKQEAPIEGYFSQSEKSMAPKSGGFIDLVTGLYIVPREDSDIDQVHKTYKAKKIGTFDPETGQYIAPSGLLLDAKEGFVVSSKVKRKKTKQILLANAENLNKNSKSKLMITTNKELESMEKEVIKNFQVDNLSNREMFSKDQFSFYFGSNSQNLEYESSGNSSKQQLEFDTNVDFGLEWRQTSSKRWQAAFKFRLNRSEANINKSSLNNPNVDSSSTNSYSIHLGSRFFIRSRLNLYSSLNFDQQKYIDDTKTTTEIINMTLTKIHIGLEWLAIKSQNTFTWVNLIPHFNFSKSSSSFKVKSGLGFKLESEFWFWWTKKHRLELGLWLIQQGHEVSTNTYKVNASRAQSGLKLGFGLVF